MIEPIRQPIFFFIVVVDEDPATVGALTGHLERRFHADYWAVGETSAAAAALERLAALRHAGDQVALRGIWPVLKRGVLANLAVASFTHLIQVIRHGLKQIRHQPGLIEGCLAGTPLTLDPKLTQRTSRIKDGVAHELKMG